MSDVVAVVKQLGAAMLDAWLVVDDQDRIVEHNQAFRDLFPRELARKLKGLSAAEAVKLPGEPLRKQCEAGPLRLDEQTAEIAGEKFRFIVGAAPVPLPEGKQGALIVLR